jgi:[acyl-carrier-protein] S-malonyltransferase
MLATPFLQLSPPPGAVLFGSPTAGTPTDFALARSHVPELLAAASALAGGDVLARASRAERFAQPAALCSALAAWRERGEPLSDYAAGYDGAGELAAFAAAGHLTFLDALRLAALRGRLLDEARLREPAAVMEIRGASFHDVEGAAGRWGLTVAADDAPGWSALTGSGPGLDLAARELGARGALALQVAPVPRRGGRALARAAARFAAALDAIDVRPAPVRVVSGAALLPCDDVRAALADGICAPRRWRKQQLTLAALGVDRFAVFSTGSHLAQMLRATLPEAVIDDVADFTPMPAGTIARA